MIQVEHEPRQIAISAVLMVATAILQTAGLVNLASRFDRAAAWAVERADGVRIGVVISGVMVYLFALHLAQMSVWAAAYWWALGDVSFPVALYESAVSFTTLDKADLPLGWKFLPAAEALTGMLMFAWSTSAMFAIMSRLTTARVEYNRKHGRWPDHRRPPPDA